MLDPLPAYVSPNLASALSGRSARKIRRLIADGALPAEGSTWQRIPLAALEKWLRRQFTITEFMAAERALDRRRAANAAYNQNRPKSLGSATFKSAAPDDVSVPT